jgi:hypothetical protein
MYSQKKYDRKDKLKNPFIISTKEKSHNKELFREIKTSLN